MILIRTYSKMILLTLILVSFSSCSSDDNSNSQNYPIILSFKTIEDNGFLYFNNGKQSPAPVEIIDNYYTYPTSISISKFKEDVKNDYYKFLSDTEIEISLKEFIFKGKYEFQNDLLLIRKSDGGIIFCAKGDKNNLKYGISAHLIVTTNGTGEGSSSDGDCMGRFPYNFNNTRDIHNYNIIKEIKANEYLLLHNLTFVFE